MRLWAKAHGEKRPEAWHEQGLGWLGCEVLGPRGQSTGAGGRAGGLKARGGEGRAGAATESAPAIRGPRSRGKGRETEGRAEPARGRREEAGRPAGQRAGFAGLGQPAGWARGSNTF